MPARSNYPDDSMTGMPVFSPHDPALADSVVHFVGRQRGDTRLPEGVQAPAPDRLSSMIQSGALWAFSVPHSQQIRAACVCDISAAEFEAAFVDGLNARGALTPWALVLDRQKVWGLGFRPVIYAETERVDSFRAASAAIGGRGWEALVVPTNPATDQRDDWTHEREWRFCFAPDTAWPALDIQSAITAVVVAERGWLPPVRAIVQPHLHPPFAGIDFEIDRWWWDDASRRLVHDGRMVIERVP